MSRARTLAAFATFAALALAAPAARAQTETFRMLQSLDTGWALNTPPVACTDTDGFVHWPNHSMTWYLNPAGQGWGKESAIRRALAIWSYDPANPTKTDFRLSWGGTRSNGYKQGDGYNMMVWSSSNLDSICKGICHAATALLLGPGQVIQESDIQFNDTSTTAFQWRIDQYTDRCWEVKDPATGAIKTNMMLDTTGIATHELGHALGIHHPTNYTTTTAVMGNTACTTMADSVRLKTDDRKALKCAENRYPQYPLYQGAIETVNCSAISGWAWNANQKDQTSYVEIVSDDNLDGNVKVLTVLPAKNYRSDVGYHGFSYVPDTDLRDGDWHWIRARYTGTQGDVGATHALACAVELLDGLSPSQTLATNGVSYEVGTQFSSIADGYITDIGYYFPPGEWDSGTHTAHLWSESNPNTPIASVIVPKPACCGGTGWAYGRLSPKVRIQANVRYRVSINTNLYQSKSPCGTSGSLASEYTMNPPLTAHQGLWQQGSGVYPNTGSCSNFFVDVRFDM